MSDISTHSTLPTNLVSYWKLDESSGTRVDSHGSNDLTDNNTVLSATGIINNGADFEATNSEYLSITDASQSGLDITGDLSISMWMKPESWSGQDFWIGKDSISAGGRSYIISTTDTYLLFDASSNGTSAVEKISAHGMSTGTMYHVVLTYNASAGTAYFYVNNSKGSQMTGFPTSIYNGNADFTIGAYGAPGNYSDGVVDEVGIWSKELTDSEVSDLYNSGSGLPYSSGGGGSPTGILTMNSGFWGTN